jgi:phage-related protein
MKTGKTAAVRQGERSWAVIFYETPQGARPAEAWLREQGPRVGARFGRIFDLLEEYGTNVRRPYVARVIGRVWEVRVEQERVQRRLFYFAAPGRKFVMLHGFVKKTRKAPLKEIEVAQRRLTDYLMRLAHAGGKQGR